MNRSLKIRFAVVSLLLLIIGFGAGFAVHRNLIEKRIDKVKRMDHPRRLADRIVDIIDADEAQSEAIDSIIKNHMKEIRAKRKEHLRENREGMVQMFEDLENEMDSEQVDRFRKARKRWMNKRKRGRKGKKKREPME